MKQKRPITEIILNVNNKVAKTSINAISNVVGFYCELFYPKDPTPTNVPRVFDNDSQKFDYSQVYDKKGNYLVFGLFGDQFKASDKSFDNYNGDQPYILTHKNEQIPTNTKVKIFREKNYHLMKVQSHNVYPSTQEGQIYFKNLLVPFN